MNNMKILKFMKNKDIPNPYWLFVIEYAWDNNMSPVQANTERVDDI